MSATALESPHLRLGYVPLCDCAPLVVARERGFFAEQGLNVTLSREPSWANIRDKLATGLLDAAQMLAPMPLSMHLGLSGLQAPIITGLALSLGGNAITLSQAIFAELASLGHDHATPHGLAQVIATRRASGAPLLTLASVYPFSPHHYELRSWLHSGGIDPDQDVRLVVVPPPRMVGDLAAGRIDGYCVGEPWNILAEQLGLGGIATTSTALWSGRIEKVLGVRQAWAEAHPHTHQAVLRALLLAGQWADAPEHRGELAELLAGAMDAPLPAIRAALDAPHRPVFHRFAAGVPWLSQARWYDVQMRRWGQVPAETPPLPLETIYRPDLYRHAAQAVGFAVPVSDDKAEGQHDHDWSLAAIPTPIPMRADRAAPGFELP